MLPVDRYGRVDPDELGGGDHRPDDAGLSWCSPTTRWGPSSRSRRSPSGSATTARILIHVDAVQAAGSVAIDLGALGVDLLSLAAHKFGGPKGAGALFVRRGTTLLAQATAARRSATGGPGRRTWPAPWAAAVALRLAVAERVEAARRARRLRERLREGLAAMPGIEVTGHPVERLPGLLSLVVRDADGAALQMALDLDGLACSTGSACTTGSTEPSHVLTAMGYPEDEARGALRLSSGGPRRRPRSLAATDLIRTAVERAPGGRRRRSRVASSSVEMSA